MIIAVCDPKGIAIEAIKTILYHDKGLSDRISRIYEFWNMEQLLDASRDSSFDCIVFPNYCNSHNSIRFWQQNNTEYSTWSFREFRLHVHASAICRTNCSI